LLTIQSMRAPKPSKSVTSLVGRLKDLIKSGGSSVDVRELEEVIAAHSALARVAAFGLPHQEKRETPDTAVELHPGAQVGKYELVAWCGQKRGRLQSPRQI
jgi:acyl-CoA synthetase (AMP-forming)/AMP-acid ligase II